jgi:RNA polymerase sigma factor (sigma-70 family)
MTLTQMQLEPLPGRGRDRPGREADPDSVLIERSWREPERFAEVFDRHYPAIHAYVSRRLGPSLADDLASETFLVAFDRRLDYDLDNGDAGPWLYGIASNLVSRQRRAEVRRYRAIALAAVADRVDGHARVAEARVDAGALRSRLAAALASIGHRDRAVLLLVAWAGLSCAEAARALDIPAGTARSRLYRARRKTRAALSGADPRATTREEDTP